VVLLGFQYIELLLRFFNEPENFADSASSPCKTTCAQDIKILKRKKENKNFNVSRVSTLIPGS
jgi:hypothetical protein